MCSLHVKSVCNYRTPLHLAAAEGNDRVAELLLSFKANVNCKDRWGGTPLKDAVVGGHIVVAESLRAKGICLRDCVSICVCVCIYTYT